MISAKGISRRLSNPALDFQNLRREGIELIQALSGDEWTDFNLHDPGVTTLEVLCYALTELGYRTQLLYDAFHTEGLTRSDVVDKYFFKPDDILKGLPVTKSDFEEFIQTNHPQVLQAWFVEYPIFSSGSVVDGGYEISLVLKQDRRYGNLNTDVIAIPFQEPDTVMEAILFDADNKRFPWKDIQQVVGCKLDEEESDNFIVFENYNCQVSLILKVIYQNRTQSDLVQAKARITFSQPRKSRRRVFQIPQKETIVRTLEGREFLNGIISALDKEKHKAGILRAVKRTLLPVRNLCEDFVALRVVNTQELKLEAEIILDDFAPHASVMIHRIYDHLDSYLLRHVVESKHEETGRRSILYGSNLIEEMVRIEGVVAARILSLNLFVDGIPTISMKGETSFECINLQQFSSYVPVVGREKSDLRFVRSDVIEKAAEKQSTGESDPRERSLSLDTDEIIESGKNDIKKEWKYLKEGETQVGDQQFFESLRAYYSIQNDFPENYRLNETFLNDKTPQSISARTRQFKSYLLFFERILIDYLDKLYHFNDLLSLRQHPAATVNELERLRKQFPEIDSLNLVDEEKWNDAFASANDLHMQLLRKNKILDHLLARFATTVPPMGQTSDSLDDLEQLLKSKTSLVQHIPEVTRERGLGVLIRPEENIWDSELLSGFQKRIYLLMGIKPESLKHVQISKAKRNESFGFYVVEHILLVKKDESNIIHRKFNNAADLLHDYIMKMSTQYQKNPAYSFQVSIILPGWYRDWREQKARVESIIRDELPAHILPYFHWLNKKNMATFESCYEDWLKALLALNS